MMFRSEKGRQERSSKRNKTVNERDNENDGDRSHCPVIVLWGCARRLKVQL